MRGAYLASLSPKKTQALADGRSLWRRLLDLLGL
jgi:hypothetical protein